MSNHQAINLAYLTLLRGGRMAKLKGVVASLAPMIGAAVIFTGINVDIASAADECGAAGAAVVCDASDTGHPVYAGGISYTGVANAMTLTLNDAAINVGGTGIDVQSSTIGTGDISIIGTNVGTVVESLGSNSGSLLAFIRNPMSASTAMVALADGSITTTGNAANGLRAQTVGVGNTEVRMDGGTVSVSGTQILGLSSFVNNTTSTAASTAVFTDGIIRITTDAGSFGAGILAQTDGNGTALAQMDGGSIITSGANASGLGSFASTAGNAATPTSLLTAGTITTSGDGANGLRITNRGFGAALGQVDGGSVVTTGDNAHGVFVRNILAASTASGVAALSGGSVKTMGATAHGALVTHSGQGIASITANGTALVSATGVDADGIRTEIALAGASYEVAVDGSASVIGGTGMGAGIHTVSVANSSGTITVGAGATIGALSDRAIADDAGATTIANSGTITGFVELGDGVDTFNNMSSNAFNIRNFADTTGNGVRDTEGLAINDFGAGVDVFNNVSTGALRLTTVSAGAGDMFGDRIEQASFINLENFNNAGLISMWETDGGAAQAGDRITITNGGSGVFTSNGGTLELETVLGDDASATDQLVVDNSRLGSGATGVLIRNAGGTGAQTLADGIKVVDVTGGTSDVGAFALAERAFAGAYEYNLFQNGVTDPSDGDWYLRSIGVNSTGATYEAAPSVHSGFNRMPTLAQRTGQRQWAGGDAAGGNMQPSGAWLRFTGDRTDLAANTGTNTSTDSWGLQAGIDFDVEGGEAGNWVLGLTTQYGTSNASVTNPLGFGEIDSEGYGLGLTATWYGNSGTYFDAQGQVNWISSDFSSSTGGVLATGQDSIAYALSAEVGHRFELSETSALIPQAQLILGQVDGASFTDTAGNTVDLGSNSSTVGRLGLAYEYESGDNTFYAIANILHDFSSANTVNVAGANLSSDTSDTWGEIGFGGEITVQDNTNLYGEVSYRQAFDNSDSNAIGVSAGLRMQF